jgi:tetratricopeptide (TPR) repeat protein
MIRGVLLSMVFVISILPACFAASPAELAQSGKYDEAIEAYGKAIGAENKQEKKAQLHKDLGDLFSSREDFGKAADQYISALASSRDFNGEERLQMATRMSWGGKQDAAIRELRLILANNAGNQEARVQLARTLSWNGDLDGSIEEAERVLSADPENRDALLVKANTLKWQGKVGQSLPIYDKLLQGEEDFDARQGLAYALLAAGDRKGARQSASLLQPRYPYQEKELKQLRDELMRIARPHLDPWYSYYSDTDHNQLNRYGLHYGQAAGNLDLDFDFRHTDARDATRHNWAQDFTARAYSKITGFLGLGGGVGLTSVHNSGTNYFVTGNVRGNVAVPSGSIDFSLARDFLSDTAELIENRIRINSATLSASQRVTGRFSVFARYSYRDYSDDNDANDFLIAPSYAIFRGSPSLTAGYRFRYMNYARQSAGGYFDPNDFMSHQIFATFSFEKEAFSSYFEPYFGVQSFRRYGNDSTDLVGGLYGSVGYQLTSFLRLDIDGEFGNSAVETATGFEYFLVGVKIGLIF